MKMTQKTITLTNDHKKGNIVKIMIQEPDPYTNLAMLEIQTIMYDAYNNQYLDPRSTKLFLTEQEILQLGRFLLID